MTTVIPNLWEELTNEGYTLGLSGLLNIWENRLRTSETRSTARPKTILAVTFMKMVNLVPQDAPHPLYVPNFVQLTDQFILDHLSLDPIDLEDPGLKSAEGISLRMMSGRDVIFRREPQGRTTTNNVEVEAVKALSDGTQVVILGNFLFTHYEDTQEAFRQIPPLAANMLCPHP